MMQMAQQFPPHAGIPPGHPGMPHGHPMAGMQHPGAAQMGGQPGPGMMHGMHPGVSGPPGTQGPMVTGMSAGPGTPAPGGQMQNAHAMAHLGPGQQPLFQQHNPQMNIGQMPLMPHQQQQMMQQRNQAFQQMMAQQQAQQQQQQGLPVNMAGGMQFNQSQLAQMKARMGGMAPNMSQMQLQQQVANQQAQAQNFQQQQRMLQVHQHQQQQQQQQVAAAQMAQQHRVAAQQMQMSRSQEPATQPPQPQSTPAPQNAVPPQSAPTPQPQPPPNQAKQQQTPAANTQQPPTNQPRSTPGEQGPNQEEPENQQQDASEEMIMPQPIKAVDFTGRLILHLLQFQDRLKNVERPQDPVMWDDFVGSFFSSSGSVKQQIVNNKSKNTKQFQIHYASLARFYHAHFVCGIQKIEMSSADCKETDFGNGIHVVSSSHSTFTYLFQNGVRVTTNGSVQVHFNAHNRIDHMSINTAGWAEYVPRHLLQTPGSPDQKQDLKINKNMKRNQAKGAPAAAQVIVPASSVDDYGLPSYMVQFLEMVETMSLMTPLFEYYQMHPGIGPRDALNQLVLENSRNFHQMSHVAHNMNGGMPPQRNQALNGPHHFQSPAMGHLGLPGQASPHVAGSVHTPSPAQNHVGGVGMMHQMSQQGSNLSGSQGPSTNTSPNVSNKRRRASAIKLEGENESQEINGGPKVKPSPQIGGKRQKGTK